MQQVAIHTPQNVEIGFATADVGKRILAKILDYLIIYILFLVLSYFYARYVFIHFVLEDHWSQIAVVQLFYLPLYTYTLWFEIILHGRTPGKLITKLQVMRLDGRPYSWENALIRWMFTIVDTLPFMGITGLITISSTKNNQRLGDMAAGTVVVTNSKQVGIEQTILLELKDDYQPKYNQVLRLSDNDMRIIKDSFELALKGENIQTVKKLRKKIEEVTEIKDPELSDNAFIQQVMKDFNFYTNK
jgi:uncharacterized RDD family membrane protein YckC